MTYTLRAYQEHFVHSILQSLETHSSTLGISATGSGKTVMAGAIISRLIEQGTESATSPVKRVLMV